MRLAQHALERPADEPCPVVGRDEHADKGVSSDHGTIAPGWRVEVLGIADMRALASDRRLFRGGARQPSRTQLRGPPLVCRSGRALLSCPPSCYPCAAQTPSERLYRR